MVHAAPLLRPSWLCLLVVSLVALSSTPPSRAHGGHDEGTSLCQQLDPSPTLQQFVDPLAFPPLVHVSNGAQLTIGAYKITQKLHRDLPETALYAYGISQEDATYPGPTLVANQHVPTFIRWENHIPDDQHFLTVDDSIDWANPSSGGVPMVPHLHGAEVQSYYDGHPEAWFTPSGEAGRTYHGQNYTYINQQSPATLWYHDHTLGITRLNVVSGLAGIYIITSEQEKQASLPLGIPLVIQDRQFYANGSINFPTVGIIPDLHPHWCPEYYGDTILVNGKVWPYLQVLPRPYRFRLLNGCNARFLVLSLSNSAMSFYQIGTDGGFVHNGPWNLSTITMAPAERVDVVIDFSGLANGTTIVLNNTGATPFPSGDTTTSPPGTFAVMEFMVVEEGGLTEGIVDVPIELDGLLDADEAPLLIRDVVVKRNLSVVEYDDSSHLPVQFTLENRTWEDPVLELPTEGDTEMWELMNLRINAHPIHIHLTSFQVLNQQEFVNVDYEAGLCSIDIPYPEEGTCFSDAPSEPYEYQKGWKDTAILWPSAVTRVLIRFSKRNGSLFSFDPTEGPGYIWHCHVVDHEDNVMMRPFKVIRNSSTTTIINNSQGHVLNPSSTSFVGANLESSRA